MEGDEGDVAKGGGGVAAVDDRRGGDAGKGAAHGFEVAGEIGGIGGGGFDFEEVQGGAVLDDRFIDQGPEWRSFDAEHLTISMW